MHEVILRGNKSFIGKNYLLNKKKIIIYNKNKKAKKNSILLHLVAKTSVANSFKSPAKTINNNLNLLIENYCIFCIYTQTRVPSVGEL